MNKKKTVKTTESLKEKVNENTTDSPKSLLTQKFAQAAPVQIGGVISDYNRRLMAALAPRPIEGVDNWGIPDEPDTPSDPEREVRSHKLIALKSLT